MADSVAFGGRFYKRRKELARTSTQDIDMIINTFANRPSAGTSGRIFLPSDGAVQFVDDGSEWKPYINGRLGKQPPLVSGFTQILGNGKATTFTDQAGTILATWSNTSGGEDLRILKKSAPTPGATGYRLTIHARPLLPIDNSSGSWLFGLGFRQSSDGSVETFQWAGSPNSANRFPIRHRYTANNTGASPTFSFSAQVVGNNGDHWANAWLRLERDTATGDRRYYTSQDGLNWRQITNMAVSGNTFITPDEVLILAWNSNDGVGGTQGVVFDSYEEVAY